MIGTNDFSKLFLNFFPDLLDKMYMVREHDPEFFLSTAHEFVGTLDIIKATRKVPETHMTKWKEFEGNALPFSGNWRRYINMYIFSTN